MPKMKTHKGVAKRVRVTRKGKVLVSRPGRRHLLSGKSGKNRRRLRRKKLLAPADAKRMKRLLGLI
ncbi:MAG TPA: 50S ribosomal protein L35 [Planctomycetota bacterium]|nr:50S ribosomal protein L35 [Planctomycetota bacterium]